MANNIRVKIKRPLVAKQNVSELKDHYERALLLFFSFPKRAFTVTELVNAINISKTTAGEIVPRLVKQGFLLKKEVGRTYQLTANTNHIFFSSRKIGYVLRNIYESGLVTHIEHELPQARNVILFGSYQTGKDTEESDIDIAVEVLEDTELTVQTIANFKQFWHRKNVPVNLHVFNRKTIDPNVFVSIANGIVLSGFLEVTP